MFIGVLQMELSIPGAQSLKDKRRVIKSVKDRLSARHNVSVAEVDPRRAPPVVLAVAMVSNDRGFTGRAFRRSSTSRVVRDLNLVIMNLALNRRRRERPAAGRLRASKCPIA